MAPAIGSVSSVEYQHGGSSFGILPCRYATVPVVNMPRRAGFLNTRDANASQTKAADGNRTHISSIATECNQGHSFEIVSNRKWVGVGTAFAGFLLRPTAIPRIQRRVSISSECEHFASNMLCRCVGEASIARRALLSFLRKFAKKP